MASPILEKLSKGRVFGVGYCPNTETFIFSENRDSPFQVELTHEEISLLADELRALARHPDLAPGRWIMPAPTT